MSDREDEIRARLAAATPGPWFTHDFGAEHGVMDKCRLRTIVLTGESDQDDADAAFVAHAPDDIAWLLGEVVRLRGVEAAAREVIAIFASGDVVPQATLRWENESETEANAKLGALRAVLSVPVEEE